MKSTLDYHDGHLCIVNESEQDGHGPDGGFATVREWYAVREAAEAEVATLVGRSVRQLVSGEGLYVDEDGEAYQLAGKNGTKPIAVEYLPGEEKTELERLLEASFTCRKKHEASKDSKRARRRIGNNRRKAQRVLRVASTGPESARSQVPPTTASGAAVNDETPENSLQMNLHQKLAEVRRRIGYIQKRGHNERFNYSYVTAADIAGAVGDLLSQLGVVVVPSLDSISYEPVRTSNGQAERVAHVVMTYTFTDVDTAEAVTVKVPGEGLDAGDKAAYKAMTGALKYALLQSFLLATGDDPEEERIIPSGDSTHRERTSDRTVTAEEARELRQLIDDTGTDLERVLAYYKVASLEEMIESAYRRAVEVLNRKLAKRGNQETVHAAD